MLTSSPKQILSSPTNTSPSKAQYSFPKAARFPISSPTPHSFYKIPSSLSTRTTTFGHGKKFDFTKEKEKTPDPGKYKVSLDILNSNKRFPFGISREESKRYIEGQISPDPSIPGPGAYSIPVKFGKEGPKFTIGGSKSPIKAASLSPGPGAYHQFDRCNIGKYTLSSFKNIQVHSFAPSSSERFIRNKASGSPAPGNYNIDKGFLRNSTILSTVKSEGSHKFGLAKRTPLNSKNESPGPGSYRLPSDFGYYESSMPPKNTHKN